MTVKKVDTRRENEDRDPLGKEVSIPSTMDTACGHIDSWRTFERESCDQARDCSWKGKGQLYGVAGQISEKKPGPKKALGPTKFKQKESSQEAKD